jgi:hypothetical protein
MPRVEYAADDVARRGRQLYEQQIRAKVEDEHAGKFLVVDVTTGEYEVAEDDLQASDRALARNPDALLYGLRIGEPAAYRIGAGHGATSFSASDDSWR